MMWPRPCRHGGNKIRFTGAVAAVALAVAGIAGCGGEDTAKSAAGAPSKGTYVNSSSPEEYCSVLEDARADLRAGVEAGAEEALVAVHAINGIEPIAPVEDKPDWSGMRLIMRAVAESDGSDTVGTTGRAEAGETYAELRHRVSESVAEICGFSLNDISG